MSTKCEHKLASNASFTSTRCHGLARGANGIVGVWSGILRDFNYCQNEKKLNDHQFQVKTAVFTKLHFLAPARDFNMAAHK